jgi:hypothetical protein
MAENKEMAMEKARHLTSSMKNAATYDSRLIPAANQGLLSLTKGRDKIGKTMEHMEKRAASETESVVK